MNINLFDHDEAQFIGQFESDPSDHQSSRGKLKLDEYVPRPGDAIEYGEQTFGVREVLAVHEDMDEGVSLWVSEIEERGKVLRPYRFDTIAGHIYPAMLMRKQVQIRWDALLDMEVEDYAVEHGIHISTAYQRLLKAGIEAETTTTDDENHLQ
jgi:hypothetical protein